MKWVTLSAVVVVQALMTADLQAQVAALGDGANRRTYLGEKPPGEAPELFAPGVVSTGDNDSLYAFLESGTVIVFDRWPSGEADPVITTLTARAEGEAWTAPQETVLLEGPSDPDLPLLPGPDSMLLGSPRAEEGAGQPSGDFNIWIARYSPDTGFSGQRIFEAPLNSDQNDIYPSATDDGTIYFFSTRGGDPADADIFRSRMSDGEYPEVERLGSVINTEHDEIDPFIAPDESYLIFCSEALDGLGDFDLYVAFRRTDGSWTRPVNMGAGINTPSRDWMPYLTADGRYFFFNSDRAGSADVYWVDAQVIQRLRPADTSYNR